MAIEVNKRKRKHKNADNEDEGEKSVPKKIAKKQKSPKNKKKLHKAPGTGEEHVLQPAESSAQEENNAEKVEVEQEDAPVEEEANQDSGFEDIKFPKDFIMSHFRNKLRGNDFITELRHFLHVCHTRPNMISKYIEKRGKPLELAEAFERIDKTNVLHVAYLCEALQLVTMEIVGNQKDHMESALHACRYFLKSNGDVVEILLKSSQLRHRRVALKLLTAIVCVEPQMGRQLLSSYDILSNVQAIGQFLSHSKLELYAADSVRKCFTHFVLAYLVDGNALLIRNILDRRALICALVAGLLYDDHVTVCMVLNTLRKYVLECPEISKTKKIHVFDLDTCKHLARLYDWKGPAIYAAQCGKKKPTNASAELSAVAEEEMRDAVAAAAHQFLVVLLTSRKHGISFDSAAHYRQKHNTIQGKLIGFLYKPWCDARKTELVLKILTACPDLARHTVRNYAGIVNVLRTAARDWVQAADFLGAIISTLRPELLRSTLDKLTLTDFSYWIKDICLPIETLVLLTGSKQLRHANTQFRIATSRLLLSMFSQYVNYMVVVRKREKTRGGDNAIRRFKFDILNHILVNFPTVENLLYSLYMSMQTPNIAAADLLQHLDVTLDLVLVISRENRSFVNKTGVILDYLKLLRPLYASDDTPGGAQGGNIKLELKAIKTILMLFPRALEPTEELFANVLSSVIKAFVYGEPLIQREAAMLLRGIFKNTQLFESSEFEIDLWLEALRYCDAEAVDTIAQVFIEVFQVTNAEVDMPVSGDIQTNTANLHKLFANIEQGLSVQAYVEPLAVSKLLPLIFKGVEIVAPLDTYLETVCLLLFHYYPMPECVQQLYETGLSAQRDYMRGWLAATGKQSALPSGIAANVPQLEQLFSHIQKADGGKLDIFGETLPSDRLYMIYVQQAMFLVAQLKAKGKLQRAQAERAATIVNGCLNAVVKLEASQTAVYLDEEDEQSASLLDAMLKYIFSVRLLHIPSAELLSATDETHLNYVHFLRLVTENCNAMPNFELHSTNYRLKVVKAVAIALKSLKQTAAASEQLTESIKLLQSLSLQGDNCVEILELLAASPLQCKHLFVGANQQRSIYSELIVCVLQRLAALRSTLQCDAFVAKFVDLYTRCATAVGPDANVEQLEEAFHDYLLVAPHYIPQLDVKLFEHLLLERKVTKASIKLACLLLERDDKLPAVFLRHLPATLAKKELNYPLLAVAFERGTAIGDAELQRVYQEYKNGFMKTIEKPQKAAVIYREHADCSIALIERCMPRSECVDFCNKNFKFDIIECYQMRLIHAIYAKTNGTLEDAATSQRNKVFVSYVQLQLQMLVLDLKKQSLNMEKLQRFAHQLYAWWQTASGELELDKVASSANWWNFCKSSLKTGMQIAEGEPLERQAADAFNGLLLKLLAYLCDRFYKDVCLEDAAAASESAEAAELFKMTCTHSKFAEILLAPQQRTSAVKTQVLHLLYVLAKKSPSALVELPIPLLLGAYQAKLSAADRYALALLQLCELHGCDVAACRPFIWGESAVAFYALRETDEERVKLQQQETSIAQVMSLVDRQVCDYTIDNFPIWRRLQAVQQMPDVHFDDPNAPACVFGTNSIERRIEAGVVADFTEAELRLCPKRAGVFEQCYDPAFFVPLMSMCFAPEAYTHPARPVQNGLLAVSFAALSSQDRDMRQAAGAVQLRYRAHFEQSKFYEKPLWIQAYENIQSGLSDLRDSWMKHKKNSGTPRVPYIAGLFVAKTLNITADPTHFLYKQLTMYLRLKSSFNFQVVPEFNLLFYSAEIEHHAARQFIVEVIRDGIKSSSDLFLLVTAHVFKVLLGFYGSGMSTLDMNLLILSVLSTCVKIPASAKIMIENVGILSWLHTVLSSLEFYHFDIIEGLITIVNNLWYSLQASQAEFYNVAYLCAQLHRLLLLLAPHLSARISLAHFAKFLNVLNKTVAGQHDAMSVTQLDNLLSCAAKHLPALVHDLAGIRQYGGAGVATHAAFCRTLQRQGADRDAILALSSLRAYTIAWRRVQPQGEGEQQKEQEQHSN